MLRVDDISDEQDESKNSITSARTVMTKPIQISDSLFEDLRFLIIEARQDVARSVNSALVMLYWRVGKRIRQDILKEKRADYGGHIVAALSQQLKWSHFKEIIPLDDDLKRDFYAEIR
jgi:DUF1016 N-terminal domain